MDTRIEDMLMQVWGLHRSGSNYVEYLIRNNIKDNNYERREVRSQFHGKRDALKHTYPDITRAKYHICLYKPVEQWMESHSRYDMKKLIDPRDAYYTWVNKVQEFHNSYPDRVVIVNYNDLVGKELHIFRGLQEQKGWQFDWADDVFKIPLKRMGKGSGLNFEK